jgi:hypothetical protein
MDNSLGALKRLALEETAASKSAEVDQAAALRKALFAEGIDAPVAPPLEDQSALQIAAIRGMIREREDRERDAFITDDERGTLKGFVGQTLGTVVQGANHLVANAASAPNILGGSADLAGVPDELRALWEKENRTPEEEAALDAVPQNFIDSPIDPKDYQTYRQILERGTDRLETGAAIKSGFLDSAAGRRVNDLSQQGLQSDLKDTFAGSADYFTAAETAAENGDIGTALGQGFMGLAKVVANGAVDLINNPAATLQMAAEQIPQLAIGAIPVVGPALLTASNVSYSASVYSDGLEAFQKANDRLPTRDEAGEMLAWSMAAGAVEQLGDNALLKAVQGKMSLPVSAALKDTVKKQTLNATIGVLAAGGDKTLDVGLKVAGALNVAPLRAAGRLFNETAAGFAIEGATEAFQTAVEENFSQLDYDLKGEEIFIGGMLGGAAGGTIRGGASAGREAAKLAAPGEEEKKETPDQRLQREAWAGAVETGDVAVFLDPAKPKTYNPNRAVNVLAQRQRRDDLEPKVREKEAQQITQLMEDQQKVVDGLVADLDRLMADENMSASEATRVMEQAEVEGNKLKQMKVAAIVPTSAERPAVETIDEMVSVASAPKVTTESEQAAKATITLMMRDPQAVKPEQVEKLMSSPAVTSEQKAYLQNFTDAHAEVNALKSDEKVKSEVITGGHGFKGIEEYEVDVSRAIREGDQAKATDEVAKLREFARTRLYREQALKTALKAAEKMKEGMVYVVRDPAAAKGYKITRTKPENWNRSLNGGLEVEANLKGLNSARKLLRTMQGEQKAVIAMGQALAGQVSLAFNTPVAAEASPQPAPATQSDEQPPVEVYEDNATLTEEDVFGFVEEGTESPKKESTKSSTKARTNPAPKKAAPTKVVAEPAPTPVTEEAQGAEVEPEPEVTVEPTVPPTEGAPSPTVEELIAEALKSRPELAAETDEDVAVEDDEEVVSLESGRIVKEVEGTVETPKNLPLKDLVDKGRNLIATYFRQRGDENDLATTNPLVVVKDFFNAVLTDAGQVDFEMVELFLKEGTTLDERQKAALQALAAMVQTWSPTIRNNMANAKTNSYSFRDLSQQFDPDEQKNVVSAIALSAFLYLAENGNAPGRNNKGDIAKILGLGSKDTLPEGAYDLLAEAGSRQNLVIQSLGGRARQALGLSAIKGGPRDSNAKLELALGAHAAALLMQTGLVEQVALDHPMLVQDRSGGLEGDGEIQTQEIGPQPFLRVVRDEESVAKPLTVAIVEVVKDTKSVINKLFSVDAAAIPPETKPGQFKQRAINKTKQMVSSIQAKIAKRASSRKQMMREDMAKVRSVLDDRTIEMMAGIDNTRVYTQESIRKSQESANDDILRDINSLASFEATHDGSPFYLVPKVVQTQRANLVSNLVDPQNSKFHRHNVTMADWQVEIDPSVPSDNLTFFKLAVAQGMGVDVDKMLQTRSLDAFDDLLKDQTIMDALEVLWTMPEEGKLSAASQAILLKAVKQGKEKFHSLDALVNLAAYVDADENYRTFSTDIMLEIDGVTNGPALAHLQLGQSLDKFGSLFGFYKSDSYRSYTEYKADPKNHDLYETVAKRVTDYLQFTNMADVTRDSLFYFLGDIASDDGSVTKDGRKLVKQPLTAMVFGSGIPTAIDDMAVNFTELLYQRLQEDANLRDLDAINETVSQFNRLLPRGLMLPKQNSIEEAMQLALRPEQSRAAQGVFTDTVGFAVAAALEEEFGGETDKQGKVTKYGFLETRNALNEAAQAMFARYNLAFNYLVQQKKREKIASGELAANNPKTGEPKAYQDLTEEDYDAIREQLKPIAPIIHTAMSKASGELSAGLDVSKTVNVIAPFGSMDYSQTVNFGASVPTPQLTVSGKPSPSVTSMTPRGMKEELQDPGVRAVIMLVHALDSAIASYSYNSVPAMNFHDALGLGMRQVLPGANALNQNTYNLLAGYSLPLEITAALERSFEGAKELSPELQQVIAEATVGKGKKTKAVTTTLLDVTRQLALGAEARKLDFLQNIEVVDQYAFEGGSYSVTERDRKRVKAKWESVVAQYNSLYRGAPDPGPLTSHSRITPQDTPWGRIGEPVVESDPVLVMALQNGEASTLRGLAQTVAGRLRDSAPSKELYKFQRELLDQIVRVANLGATVNYIEADTKGPDGKPPTAGVAGARGWYSLSANGEVINIKSPDFESSGITAELMLHEMTHAAIAQTIHRLRNGKPGLKDLPAVEGLQELDTLRDLAAEFIKANGLTQFDEAVKDVDELVAWGMTNAEFQDQVLRQIQMTSTGKTRARKHGLLGFIESLVKLLFNSKEANITDMTSGLGVLVTNTAFLFDAAERTERQENANLHQEMAAAGPASYTTAEIFEGLANVDPDFRVTDTNFRNQLKDALTQVVGRVYSMNGIFESAAQRAAGMTAEDVFINAMATGQAPFASRLKTISMSQQERFVAESVEVTVREALNTKGYARFALREATALYKYAKEVIREEDFYQGPDWATASEEAREPAKQAYALIFTAEQGSEGKSDYLSRFVAASLAYKPLYDALSRVSGPVDTRRYFPEGSSVWEGKSWSVAMRTFIERALNVLGRFYTKTRKHQTAGQQLGTLATNIAHVRATREEVLQRQRDKPDMWIETQTKRASEKLRRGVVRAGESDFFQKSKNEYVQAVGNITSTVAGQRVVQVMDQFMGLRNKAFDGRMGIAGEMYNEFRGETDMNAWAHKLHTEANAHEQNRKRMMDQLGKFVNDSFGRDLTKAESESLTRAVLRTDLTALQKVGYSLDEIVEVLADRAELDKRIKQAEDELTGPYADAYIEESRALGYFMATGKTRSHHLLMNARNIAFRAGTAQVIRKQGPEALQAQANQAIIDELATLNAVLHTSRDAKTAAVNVARSERGRDDQGNGFDVILKLHQSMQDDALQNLFDGSEMSFIKGYTREIYNPYVQVVAATASEGAILMKAGYVPINQGKGSLPQDPADPTNEARQLYKIEGKGLSTMITGIMPNTGRRRKGTSIAPGVTSLSDEQTVLMNRRVVADIGVKKAQAMNAMVNRGRAFDPTKVTGGNLMVPVINARGEVIDYRYMMEENTKDVVLDRNNRLDKVFGAMGGSMLDKKISPLMSKAAIDAVKAQYDQDYLKNQEAYVEFGPNSPDADLLERYRLLPEDAKAMIRSVWGTQTMYIRNDQLNLVLGYRKYSLSDMFDEDAHRNYMEKVFVYLTELLLGKKASLRVMQAEDIWQELVREVKDTWVIKNFFTLLGNESSNFTILLLSGVPIKDIIRNKAIAYQAMKEYQGDRRRKFELEKMISLNILGPNDLAAARQELIVVEDSMARNPVKELVDANMSQTLVEDVTHEDDPYSYKSRLTRKVDKYTLANSPNRAIQLTRAVGKSLLMTHDTPIYKLMNDLTIMSDFTSRYVLHQHLTTRKNDPMSTAESLQRARAAFVNYDVPTHKGVQYMNDMGLLWFTKYYMRIQMVIIAMVRENPARALALLSLDMWSNFSSILDSSMFQKWPGNLGMGALEWPGSLKEIWTLKAFTPL